MDKSVVNENDVIKKVFNPQNSFILVNIPFVVQNVKFDFRVKFNKCS